jgi:hypothetical protein
MSVRSVAAVALLAAGLTGIGLTASLAAQGAWTNVIGPSLANWTPVGDANWRVAEGAVEADKGMMAYLVSKDSYSDFQIRAEVWVSPDANSGIFIRCADPKMPGADSCYEVNLFDTRPEPKFGTGAIVNVAEVAQPYPKAGGKWNVLEIEARGPVLSVTLNGQKTVNAVRDTKHAAGPFALQYGAGTVKFRKVEIRPL